MQSFAFARAHDADDAVAEAGAAGEFLAGGTTMLDLMKLGVWRPQRLIDLHGLRRDHAAITLQADGLHLGALVTMAEAAAHPGIRADYPAVAQSLALAASPQLRNMASLAGNVLQRTRCNYFRDTAWQECNKRVPGSGCAAIGGVNRNMAVLGTSEHCIASYPGDFAVVLAALAATVTVHGADGPRTLAFADLHRAPGERPDLETTLRHGDLITGLHVPASPAARRSIYVKVRDRESYAFAEASACVGLHLLDGRVHDVRVGLGGVATVPWRSEAAEAALRGHVFDEALAQQAAVAAFAGAVTHGGNDHKPELGRRTLVRALLACAAMEG